MNQPCSFAALEKEVRLLSVIFEYFAGNCSFAGAVWICSFAIGVEMP